MNEATVPDELSARPAASHAWRRRHARRARPRRRPTPSAVVITAITAVTVLAVLEHPVPAVLSALASVACLLLIPGRMGRLLAALTTGGRG
ncbi:hypothetical protein [Streptomyces prasinopilosus]|uniref:hypothetical protein n=1 Tax=Streptomyces prasinopilosus TaxID=67344 RepID=UPI0006EBDB38|nr:hypothetical protein [Streptomyces prasinopilosus]